MAISDWNGLPLPQAWCTQSPSAKSLVIGYLQGRVSAPPTWWRHMGYLDRKAVVLHLCTVGSVSAHLHPLAHSYGLEAREATKRANIQRDQARVAAYRSRHSQPYAVFEESTRVQPMLYPPPNGGQRILPSVYTKLADRWLRANGVYNNPDQMNQGHLKNCVGLLNESHVNFVDKATGILGKIHGHLTHRPDLQAKLEDLFHELERLQVGELYPIVVLLASYIEPEPAKVFDDGDFDVSDLSAW